MGSFLCARCGICCKETAALSSGGDIFGLYLEPDEIHLFPKDLVFPLLGRGDPIIVTAYQLGVNRCPNYVEEGGKGRCLVYGTRPRTCAAFPVTSRSSVSPHCPTVRALKDGVDPESVKAELAVHDAKLRAMVDREPDQWVWPLNKKTWIPVVDAVYFPAKR